jgi:phosphoribosyl 1,2-cyclic phosphate phosphodiesterase
MLSGTSHGTITLLGTGTSVGVPVIGCDCATCTSPNPRNKRMRCGVAVQAAAGTFVIDTPPELRLQLVRESIPMVHAAVFTHGHADHVFGLDDLRICGHRLDRPIPLYCEEGVEKGLRKSFYYAFGGEVVNAHNFAIPKLAFERIGPHEPFELLGVTVRPLRLMHGKLPILGFRINDFAYCTDVSGIPPESLPLLEGLDALVIGALRDEPHVTHFSVGQALEQIERLRPRRAYLTHTSHSLKYEETNARLPAGVELANDGLRLPF